MSKLFWIRMTKNKIFFLIPFFLLVVVLPLLIYIMRIHGENRDLQVETEIMQQLHVWIPMFSSWWIIVYSNDFFSADGNELLYLFHKSQHIYVGELVCVIGYILCTMLVFPIYQRIYPIAGTVLWQVVIESVMIAAFMFFLSFALQNTGAALLIVIVYCVYLNLFDVLHMFDFISIFPREYLLPELDTTQVLRAIISGAVFWCGGMLTVKKNRIYK